jgi:hypothetical protein
MRDKDREFICFFQVGGIFFFFRPDTKEKEPTCFLRYFLYFCK